MSTDSPLAPDLVMSLQLEPHPARIRGTVELRVWMPADVVRVELRATSCSNSLAPVRSSKVPGRSTVRRRPALIAVLSLIVAASSLPAFASTALAANSVRGKLIAYGKIGTPATTRAHFHHVRPAQVFLLVLTAPSKARVGVTWTIACFDPAHRASGGASGQATVTQGHWAKHVRANWIKHPAYCSGSVNGLDERSSPDSGSLHIRVYAE